MAGNDFRQRLTDKLVEYLEENDGMPWERGWNKMPLRPMNPASKVKYRGGNVVSLLMEALDRNSDDPRWMTINQANKAGYSIRKGAKAAVVEYWDWGQQKAKPDEDPEKAAEGEEGKKAKSKSLTLDDLAKSSESDDAESEVKRDARVRPRPFYSLVFNGADIVGLPKVSSEVSWDANALAEQLIVATGARIEHKALSKAGGQIIGNAAYYDGGAADKIVVPPKAAFKSAADYYATVVHELVHWTGGKARLDRLTPDMKFGSPAYAQEELRAEIGAMFLTSMLGIEGKVQNHARYAASWVAKLKEDKHEIFRAARDAEKIVDYLLEFAPEIKLAMEARLTNNVLPDEKPKRKYRSEVDELPQFGPAATAEKGEQADAGVPKTGRDDPRWEAFAIAVRDQAKAFGISDETVETTFKLLEEQFTPLMDSAATNGYTVEDMNSMLVNQLMEEMRANAEREQQWIKYEAQVRKAAEGVIPDDRLEVGLQAVQQRFQSVVQRALAEGWESDRTDSEIYAVVFGEKGRRKIDAGFVTEMFGAAEKAASVEDEEELVLSPGGSAMDWGDADMGSIQDEPLALARHAKNQESNTPSP